MKSTLVHEGETVGTVITNRSLSIADIADLLNIDLDETVNGDPVWNIEEMHVEIED